MLVTSWMNQRSPTTSSSNSSFLNQKQPQTGLFFLVGYIQLPLGGNYFHLDTLGTRWYLANVNWHRIAPYSLYSQVSSHHTDALGSVETAVPASWPKAGQTQRAIYQSLTEIVKHKPLFTSVRKYGACGQE